MKAVSRLAMESRLESPLMAESSQPAFGTTRPKPVGKNVNLVRPLQVNAVGKGSAPLGQKQTLGRTSNRLFLAA